MKRNKNGQIWIETVLYTLIGLVLIGLALGFIMPKINEARDKIAVEQAINSLGAFDEKITDAIQRGTGNIRRIEFVMKKGELYVDGGRDEIRFILSGLAKPYSEPGVSIAIGRVNVTSSVGQKTSSVSLVIQYPATNVTYAGKDELKKFTAASIPYDFSIEHKSTPSGSSKIWINIEEISGR